MEQLNVQLKCFVKIIKKNNLETLIVPVIQYFHITLNVRLKCFVTTLKKNNFSSNTIFTVELCKGGWGGGGGC